MACLMTNTKKYRNVVKNHPVTNVGVTRAAKTTHAPNETIRPNVTTFPAEVMCAIAPPSSILGSSVNTVGATTTAPTIRV